MGTLDLTSLLCKMAVSLTVRYPFVVEEHFYEAAYRFSGRVRTRAYRKNNLLQHTSKTMLLKRCFRLATISWSHSLNSLCKFGNLAL